MLLKHISDLLRNLICQALKWPESVNVLQNGGCETNKITFNTEVYWALVTGVLTVSRRV